MGSIWPGGWRDQVCSAASRTRSAAFCIRGDGAHLRLWTARIGASLPFSGAALPRDGADVAHRDADGPSRGTDAPCRISDAPPVGADAPLVRADAARRDADIPLVRSGIFFANSLNHNNPTIYQRTPMPSNDYVPNSDLAFCSLLAHITSTLPQYYTVLGISSSTPQLAVHVADSAAFTYLCNRQVTLGQAAQAATKERNRARYGDPENPNASTDLSWPTALSPVPSPVLPGVEKRFRDFVQWLRALPAYDSAIGEALHIVAPASTPPEPSTLQPELTLRLNGGKVEVRWTWGAAAGTAKALMLEVDRGQGAQFLAVDTNPNYTDSSPFPPAGAKWRYRGIWQRNGETLGQWSPWVEILVG
jgi:hypothetical protein